MIVDYQETFFHQASLREAAMQYIKVLPDYVDTIISTGSSGLTIATAMLLLSKRRLFHTYIRKGRETGHGNKFVGATVSSASQCAFVDDFISTGSTLKRVLKACEGRCDIRTIIVGNAPGFNDIKVINRFEEKFGLKIFIVRGHNGR